MLKSFSILFVFVVAIAVHPQLLMLTPFAEAKIVPLPPNTASFASDPSEPAVMVGTSFATVYTPDPSEYPVRIVIPSIQLNAPVQHVGINSLGEMDVPDGTTPNVGWYQYGPLPGDLGNAVMDAHVFAAFKKLRYAKIGDEISVVTAGGAAKRFLITDSRVYPVSDVPMQAIFSGESEGLVLITCARKFLPHLNTYSHRLVVSATLIE
jgi:sortase A